VALCSFWEQLLIFTTLQFNALVRKSSFKYNHHCDTTRKDNFTRRNFYEVKLPHPFNHVFSTSRFSFLKITLIGSANESATKKAMYCEIKNCERDFNTQLRTNERV
jgi:hypothetical protein